MSLPDKYKETSGRKKLIIGIIAVLVIGLGITVGVLVRNDKGEQNDSEISSADDTNSVVNSSAIGEAVTTTTTTTKASNEDKTTTTTTTEEAGTTEDEESTTESEETSTSKDEPMKEESEEESHKEEDRPQTEPSKEPESKPDTPKQTEKPKVTTTVTTKAPPKTTTTTVTTKPPVVTEPPVVEEPEENNQGGLPDGNFDFIGSFTLVDSSAGRVYEGHGGNEWALIVDGGDRWFKFNEAWGMCAVRNDDSVSKALTYVRACTVSFVGCDVLFIPSHWTSDDIYNNYGLEMYGSVMHGTYVDKAGDGMYVYIG